MACVLNYFFGKWALADMASTHTDVVEVADLATTLGPDDPQTHYAAAVIHEKSFSQEDIEFALREYSFATALSPNNYLYWLELGSARSRAGDLSGAENSLNIALKLAPNYGSVRWAFGNVLLRQGRPDEAFEEIRKAVECDPSYAPAAADIAWQYFSGDISGVRNTIGGSQEIIGALIARMAAQKRLDEAITVWKTVPGERTAEALKTGGKSLYTELAAAKRFRDAFRVYSDVTSSHSSEALKIAAINNGGFEGDIRMNAGAIFEWTIGDGIQPQVVLTDGQKHGGDRSLLMVFGSADPDAFRSISQTVAVDPGRTYLFEAFYRSDVRSRASTRWEIVDAADGKVLGTTESVVAVQDWTRLTASFSVPTTSDGVIIRLAKSGCVTQSCPVDGRIWFDDLSLRAK